MHFPTFPQTIHFPISRHQTVPVLPQLDFYTTSLFAHNRERQDVFCRYEREREEYRLQSKRHWTDWRCFAIAIEWDESSRLSPVNSGGSKTGSLHQLEDGLHSRVRASSGISCESVPSYSNVSLLTCALRFFSSKESTREILAMQPPHLVRFFCPTFKHRSFLTYCTIKHLWKTFTWDLTTFQTRYLYTRLLSFPVCQFLSHLVEWSAHVGGYHLSWQHGASSLQCKQ